MKNALLALAVCMLVGSQVQAATQYWDSDGTATGNDISGTGLGGTGNWDATPLWWDGSAGTDASWTDGNDAVFTGAAGTVTLTAAKSATGVTFKTNGYIVTASPLSTALTLTGGASIVVDPGVTATLGPKLSGTVGYNVSGGGTVLLNNGANSNVTGAVSVTGGSTLRLATGGAIGGTGAGSGNITLNNGTLQNDTIGAGITFLTGNRGIIIGASGGTINSPGSLANIQIYTSGSITGVGNTLTKTGPGILRVTTPTSITFSKLVVTGGLYQAAVDTSYGAVPGSALADAITLNGGGLGLSAGVTFHANRGITLGANGGTFDGTSSATVAGKITGSGTLNKTGTGTYTLNGNNDYTGNTLITGGGEIAVGNANALGTTAGYTDVAAGSEVLFTGATTNFAVAEPIRIAGAGSTDGGAISVTNSATPTISGPVTLTGDATITVSGTSGVTFNNAAAITSTSNQNLTLTGGTLSTGSGGTISGVVDLGAGGLTKNLGGKWYLSGANVYSGGTVINSGTLYANNSTGSATGSGAVSVVGGTLAGTGAVAGPVSVSSGAFLAPGASVESLDTGAVSLASGATLQYELDSTAALAAGADLLNSSGALTLTAGALLTISDVALTSTLLPADTKFTMVRYSAGGWNGVEFNLYPDDSTFTLGANTFVINYNDTAGGVNFGGGSAGGGYLTLVANPSAVPEASAILFGALASCVAGGIQHWRRGRA